MTAKCPKCKKESDLSDLAEDYYEKDGEEIYCTVVCPHCGFWLGEEDEVNERYIILNFDE